MLERPPVPTLTVNPPEPLFVAMDAPVPVTIVGAPPAKRVFAWFRIEVVLMEFGVEPPMEPGEAKVAPLSCATFRLGTTVVLVTVNGAVPVATVEISFGAETPPVPA